MASGFLNFSHTYKKDDCTVTVTNMKSVVESKVYGQLKKFRKGGGEPAGQYMLLVMKMKGAGDTSSATPQLNPGK